MQDDVAGRSRRAAASAASGSIGIPRMFPDLEEDLLLDLFHKGARVQWTSRDLDWGASLQLGPRQRPALARLLTPVYLGEQSAMLGASAIIPQLAAAGETTAQLYLTTFMLDEARHFEALTRMYRALESEPMSLRELPDMLRYHHRLRGGDRVDWVWGILISDLYAKIFYRSFTAAQPQALFGQMSAKILQDESRHQAFAIHYLGRNLPRLEPARRAALVRLRDDLYRLIEGGLARLRADCDALGYDTEVVLAQLWAELEQASRRIGLDGGRPTDEPPAPGAPTADGQALAGAAETEPVRAVELPAVLLPDERREPLREQARRFFAVTLPSCFGCLLVALCRPRAAAR